MSRLLLDTDVLIDFSKGHQPVCDQVEALLVGPDEVGACPITLAEFFVGVPEDRRDHWAEFFDALPYWPITRRVAQRAGEMRHVSFRRGQPLSITDALIAAVAEAQGRDRDEKREGLPESGNPGAPAGHVSPRSRHRSVDGPRRRIGCGRPAEGLA